MLTFCVWGRKIRKVLFWDARVYSLMVFKGALGRIITSTQGHCSRNTVINNSKNDLIGFCLTAQWCLPKHIREIREVKDPM